MIEYIRTALKDLQKLHSLYGATFGLLFLVSFLAAPSLIGVDVNIFGILVIGEKYSLIVGLLFGAFVVALLLKLRQLRHLVAVTREGNERDSAVRELRYYPWVMSPFQGGALGRQGFWGSLLVGSVYVGVLGILHILDPFRRGVWHQLIGLFDLFILGLVLLLFRELARTMKELDVLVRE